MSWLARRNRLVSFVSESKMPGGRAVRPLSDRDLWSRQQRWSKRERRKGQGRKSRCWWPQNSGDVSQGTWGRKQQLLNNDSNRCKDRMLRRASAGWIGGFSQVFRKRFESNFQIHLYVRKTNSHGRRENRIVRTAAVVFVGTYNAVSPVRDSKSVEGSVVKLFSESHLRCCEKDIPTSGGKCG